MGIGECFGLPAGTCETGKLAAALHRMGFDDVFDTNWGADLTIMEEGTEFLERFRAVISGGVATLPMITSCSPGWIQFIEHNYPEHLDNLSTCKSPHEMFGAVVKSYYAKKLGKSPRTCMWFPSCPVLPRRPSVPVRAEQRRCSQCGRSAHHPGTGRPDQNHGHQLPQPA